MMTSDRTILYQLMLSALTITSLTPHHQPSDTRKNIVISVRLDIRQYYFTNRVTVVYLWNTSPENAISANSLFTSEGRLDGTWKWAQDDIHGK